MATSYLGDCSQKTFTGLAEYATALSAEIGNIIQHHIGNHVIDVDLDFDKRQLIY